MADITRRNLLQAIAAAPVAAGLVKDADARPESHAGKPGGRQSQAAPAPFQPRFFTAHELATVTLLASLVIPADERSGGAAEAGVPEFIDFMMIDQPERQIPMRGGLAWLDAECQGRFDEPFVGCSDADRKAVLDDIAWPGRSRPEHSQGAAFFSAFRDLVATGFWTSRIGIDDLQYLGNTFVAEWNGCPDEVLAKLGLK